MAVARPSRPCHIAQASEEQLRGPPTSRARPPPARDRQAPRAGAARQLFARLGLWRHRRHGDHLRRGGRRGRRVAFDQGSAHPRRRQSPRRRLLHGRRQLLRHQGRDRGIRACAQHGGAPCRDRARRRARGNQADLSGQGLRGRGAGQRRQRHHRGDGTLDRNHDDRGARSAADQPLAGKSRA